MTPAKHRKATDHKIVSKSWGHEIWLVNNEKYCGKILSVNQGCSCSFHQHDIKAETFFVQSGSIRLEVGKEADPRKAEIIALNTGDTYDMEPNTWHRFTAISGSATLYEFSTTQSDEDVTRL